MQNNDSKDHTVSSRSTQRGRARLPRHGFRTRSGRFRATGATRGGSPATRCLQSRPCPTPQARFPCQFRAVPVDWHGARWITGHATAYRRGRARLPRHGFRTSSGRFRATGAARGGSPATRSIECSNKRRGEEKRGEEKRRGAERREQRRGQRAIQPHKITYSNTRIHIHASNR